MPSPELNDNGEAWLNMIQSAWTDLTTRKGISDIDMQFVQVHRRTEFTIDRLIEGMLKYILTVCLCKNHAGALFR